MKKSVNHKRRINVEDFQSEIDQLFESHCQHNMNQQLGYLDKTINVGTICYLLAGAHEFDHHDRPSLISLLEKYYDTDEQEQTVTERSAPSRKKKMASQDNSHSNLNNANQAA